MAEPGEQRQVYGHYEVESVLGRGAMGMVYLARDQRIGRRVALKTVHVTDRFDDDSEMREFYSRLQREAELCGSLHHPNIVTLFEPGYENGTIAWLATEYVDGESLRDLMKKRKPLGVDEALRIAEGILRGLAYAHGKGVIHRDIKPANILLTSTGEAKIADFGIARPADSTLTAVGELLGTPSYMSPEQVKCQPVTERSDLFAVGTVLYEMLTGMKAFAGPDVSGILRNVVERTPKPASDIKPDISPALASFVARLFEKAPNERFPSAQTALDELRVIRRDLAGSDAAAAATESPFQTLTVPASAKLTNPTLTDVDLDDATPPISSRSRQARAAGLVAPAVFWIVVLLAAGALVASVVAIQLHSDPNPTVRHSPAQLREFDQKRQAMNGARQLLTSGRIDESISAFNAYLAQYPYSIAAQQGLAQAEEALKLSQEAQAKVTVTTKKRPPASEAEKKRSIWQRLFRRK